MKDELHTNPLEDTASAIRDYVDLKVDEAKLNIAESLAKILSKLIYIIVMMVIGGLAAVFAAVCICKWIAIISGSEILGPVIMLGIFILLGLIFFLRKHSVLMDSNLRMFLHIFFERDAKDDSNNDDHTEINA